MPDKLYPSEVIGTQKRQRDMGDGTHAEVVAVGEAGFPGAPKSYTLLDNANTTGAAVAGVAGRRYLWRVEASAWNAATVMLQGLGLDGTSWTTIASANSNATVPVEIGHASTVRAAISGSPTGVRSNLGGV